MVPTGSRDGVRPADIVGAIAGTTGLEGRYVGRIDIQENRTLVDLPAGLPPEFFKRLGKFRIRKRFVELQRDRYDQRDRDQRGHRDDRAQRGHDDRRGQRDQRSDRESRGKRDHGGSRDRSGKREQRDERRLRERRDRRDVNDRDGSR